MYEGRSRTYDAQGFLSSQISTLSAATSSNVLVSPNMDGMCIAASFVVIELFMVVSIVVLSFSRDGVLIEKTV